MTFVLNRTLHLTNPLMQGQDVRELQQLLTTKGFPVAVDGLFGPQTADACVRAKVVLGYPSAQVTPTAAELLVSKLQAAPAHTPYPQPTRDNYVKGLNWVLAHPHNWRYAEVRPIPFSTPPWTTTATITTDCSGSVALIAKWTGAPDPSARGFDGEGYTGFILSRQPITSAQLLPGDLIVYGAFPGQHVVAYLGGGMVFSHGHSGDPAKYTLSGMSSYFLPRFPPHYRRFISG